MQRQHAEAAVVAEVAVALTHREQRGDVAQAGEKYQHGAILVRLVDVAEQLKDEIVVDLYEDERTRTN